MASPDRLLVLVRHGQSEWNLLNLFTGWKDPGLTELGIEEARTAGRRLKDLGLSFDIAYTSALSRAQATSDLILEEPAPAGARSRCTSGAAPTTCSRLAANP
jgi:2,3-bisphosphoglycerate-dependent phosphoglycerate mutase